MEFNGNEIINVDRTETYVEHAGFGWFKPNYRNGNLGPMLGETYGSPFQDPAPWSDDNDAASFSFFGLYPLEVAGIEDSTTSAEVVESILDGGVVGRPRRTTRSIVVSGVLLGADECGVEFGMRWLKSCLGPGPCGTASGSTALGCSGASVCYLSCEPSLDWTVGIPAVDVTACMDPYLRSLRKASVITGPTITGRSNMPSGGAAWVVTFTVVCGDPYEYGLVTELVAGFPGAAMPYVGGEIPEGGSFDPNGFSQSNPSCPTPTYQPVYDPLCPQAIPPPGIPSVPLSCFSFPVNYNRRQVVIPKQYISTWGTTVPIISVGSRTKDVRSVRVRFFADPFGRADPNDDACSYCVDIVFSYVPADSTLVVDGVERLVYLENRAGRRRADSLVHNSLGEPFEWPELSCGVPYVMTVDIALSGVIPSIDLALANRAA
jgi:hypothetical protein